MTDAHPLHNLVSSGYGPWSALPHRAARKGAGLPTTVAALRTFRYQ